MQCCHLPPIGPLPPPYTLMYMAFIHSCIQRYIHLGDAVLPHILKYYKTNIQWVYEGHEIYTPLNVHIPPSFAYMTLLSCIYFHIPIVYLYNVLFCIWAVITFSSLLIQYNCSIWSYVSSPTLDMKYCPIKLCITWPVTLNMVFERAMGHLQNIYVTFVKLTCDTREHEWWLGCLFPGMNNLDRQECSII